MYGNLLGMLRNVKGNTILTWTLYDAVMQRSYALDFMKSQKEAPELISCFLFLCLTRP